MALPLTTTKSDTGFQVKALEQREPLKLAMQRLWISGRILPVGARLMAHHVFRCDERRPVEVFAAALSRPHTHRRRLSLARQASDGLSAKGFHRARPAPSGDGATGYSEGGTGNAARRRLAGEGRDQRPVLGGDRPRSRSGTGALKRRRRIPYRASASKRRYSARAWL